MPEAGDATWWRAFTLEERCNSGTGIPRGRPSAGAARRLGEWRGQTPFGNDDWFGCLLTLYGLDESSFLDLLGEEDVCLRQRIPAVPAWLSRLESVYGSRPAPGRLLPVVGPLIVSARERLLKKARDLTGRLPHNSLRPESIAEQLVSALLVRVDGQISRSVVLEMRVASLQGRLTGADQAERFRSFLDRLRVPAEALSFLRQYPVLARFLVESIEAWTASAAELLDRLGADWEVLREQFWPDRDPGPLISVETGAGDVHRSGRTVVVLGFGSGERLVYKPRSLRIDRHFAELLRWLQERGAPKLRVPRILDRGTYGWAEFIHPAPCLEPAEARRFYERQGALLAILYALKANDFHRDNLIAMGEHPVPIDLETLCGPDYGQAQESSYDSHAEFEIVNSVVNTMLLPVFQGGERQRGFDASALGGRGGQLSIQPVGEWENLGTDGLKLTFDRREVPPRLNQPRLGDSPLNAFDFVAEIETGFRSMYHLLARHRDELLSEEGPIAAMREDEVRVVLRGTPLYSMLVERSLHPDHLGDALERDRLFARLWFGIERTEFVRSWLHLLPSEHFDLSRGEIPYFTTRVGSRDLWTSRGVRLRDFFLRSGGDVIRDRFAQLGEEDLRRQIQFIRGSLGAVALDQESTFRRYSPPVDVQSADRDRLLAQALKIVERIVELAYRRDDRASWVGLSHGESSGWHLRPLQTDLYSGLPGLILFLAYAGAVADLAPVRSLAEAALETLRRQMKRRQERLRDVGGFQGWGGLLYLWLHLSRLWRNERFLAEAEDMALRLAELAEADEHLDVIQGSAGAIVPLLSLHRLTGAAMPLEIAGRLGDRLLRLARPWAGGIGWCSPLYPTRPMTGFAHGGSGFAWAFGELFALTGNAAYERAALQALACERSSFSREAGNWEDLRQSSQDRGARYMVAWCHGACGIGMSRLRLLQHLDDADVREELRAALETTCTGGFGSNHSLCHGDMGSLDLLLQASHSLPERVWKERLAERTAWTLASAEQGGWRCGVPLDVETPGLMDGLAGIGYGFLRLAEPDRVPSVTILEGPKIPI